MPIELISYIVPKNNGDFPILEDIHLMGGYRIVANATERDGISADHRKNGMLVYVQNEDLVYRLQTDLITWQIDDLANITLQKAYENGNEIDLVTSKAFTIKKDGIEILKVSEDKSVEVFDTLRVKDYTSSINANVIALANNTILDFTDKTKYKAIQYFYTIKNNDGSGFETGQIYVIHDGSNAIISSILGVSMGTPSGISFDSNIIGSNVNLLASADSSSFSRNIHLFKVALI